MLGRRDLVRTAWANSAPHHGFGQMHLGEPESLGHGVDRSGVGDDSVRQFTKPWTISSTRAVKVSVTTPAEPWASGRWPIRTQVQAGQESASSRAGVVDGVACTVVPSTANTDPSAAQSTIRQALGDTYWLKDWAQKGASASCDFATGRRFS